jgi:hypothetical protein
LGKGVTSLGAEINVVAPVCTAGDRAYDLLQIGAHNNVEGIVRSDMAGLSFAAVSALGRQTI